MQFKKKVDAFHILYNNIVKIFLNIEWYYPFTQRRVNIWLLVTSLQC